ncbi:hypothetical protein [Isoptericola variabilis]|nr:hypothetical protein [Isoptericola variabilis]TWH26594.1 hypothetical protein L600_000600000740 [Isoptericola variabilis J7]
MMLALTGGRERTLDEYDRLHAGLTMVRATPTATSFSVIEATAAR